MAQHMRQSLVPAICLAGNPFRTDFILLHIASTIDGIPNIQSQDTLTEYKLEPSYD
jgi:hypothetical protein